VIVPGSIASTTFDIQGAGVYSAAGTTQGAATPLTTSACFVSGTSTHGVILPASAAPGTWVMVQNTGATTFKIYPASGESIDDAAVNVPTVIPANQTITFQNAISGTWYSVIDGLNGTSNQINVSHNSGGTISISLPSSLTLPGTMTAGGAIAMATYAITGLADPTNAQDAATKNYVTTNFSPLAGSSSLTTTGTITTGIWNGTAIDADHGGGLYNVPTTIAGSVSGNLYVNEAFQATGLKIMILSFAAFNDAGQTYNFPTAFTTLPGLINGVSLPTPTFTTTGVTIPATGGAITGSWIFIGM
jgi:hypothetical protein